MKNKINLIFILLTTICFSQNKSDLNPYLDFLQSQNTSAKDYILTLFKTHDIVILCERNHNESTQYDLIYEVVNSNYFQENVGNIFTEIGSLSNRKNTMEFTKTKFTNNNIKQLELTEIYRNGFFPPLWNNTNFYDFISKINSLNSKLKSKKQINLFTSGTLNPTIEERTNASAMKNYVFRNYVKRDSLMASYIIKSYDSIVQNSYRKKALVIMNYRHAFSKNLLPNDSNVATFLFEKYKTKVANVYINSLATINVTEDPNKAKIFQGLQQIPIQEGKWDASFKILNKENNGFNFKNSPFGKDSFDIWSTTKTNYKYEDIFTGFVYYLPLEKHQMTKGIKNFLMNVDIQEIVNEWNLFNDVLGKKEHKEFSPELEKHLIEETSTLSESKYPKLKDYESIINQWLK